MLIQFRNLFRLIDLENTKDYLGIQKWEALFHQQIFYCSVMYLLCIFFFEMTPLRILQNFVYLIFWAYTFIINGKETYQIIFFLIGCTIFLGAIGRHIFETVINMDIKINDNAKFKDIFNNIDESIIILS